MQVLLYREMINFLQAPIIRKKRGTVLLLFSFLMNLDIISVIMSSHEPFALNSSTELPAEVKALNIDIPFQGYTFSLFERVTIRENRVPNRLAVQSMEGPAVNLTLETVP